MSCEHAYHQTISTANHCTGSYLNGCRPFSGTRVKCMAIYTRTCNVSNFRSPICHLYTYICIQQFVPSLILRSLQATILTKAWKPFLWKLGWVRGYLVPSAPLTTILKLPFQSGDNHTVLKIMHVTNKLK